MHLNCIVSVTLIHRKGNLIRFPERIEQQVVLSYLILFHAGKNHGLSIGWCSFFNF